MNSIWLYQPYDPNKGNILLLHGFLESSDTWKVYLPKLNKYYNCLLYDFPGHGRNQNFPLNDISFQFIAQDIVNSIIELNLLNVHLICHSMGGYFGCYLKSEYKQYFNKIILSNSTLKPDNPIQIKKRYKIKKIIENNLSLLCKVSFLDDEKDDREIKERNCNSCNPIYVSRVQDIILKRQDYTSLFKRYTKDFFFIFGEQDKMIPWQEIKELTKNRQYIFLNEGHALPVKSKNKWISIVLEHLK